MLHDDAITHKYTRPFRPQTNGEVERFNRTLAECLYARAWDNDQERSAALAGFLHRSNYHRPHYAASCRSTTPRSSPTCQGFNN